MTAHTHIFDYDPKGRMRCDCGDYLFQHAPDHPYGSQPGPNGMYARWCLRDDCDWRHSGKTLTDAGYASTAVLLLTLILGSLAFLLVLDLGQNLRCDRDPSLAYCSEAK